MFFMLLLIYPQEDLVLGSHWCFLYHGQVYISSVSINRIIQHIAIFSGYFLSTLPMYMHIYVSICNIYNYMYYM